MKKKYISFFLFSIILISLLSMNQQNSFVFSSADTSYVPWHFIALGDSRNWEENSTHILRKTIFEDVMYSNLNLDFILHTGDMVNNGGEQDDWDRYYEDIDLLVQNDVTFYYAVGNHERYTYNLPNGTHGPIDTNFTTYKANVEMLGNEIYYSFDYKGIHFIFMNSGDAVPGEVEGEYEIGAEQKEFIINDLQSNTMNFTIATFHRPAYSVRSQSRVEQAAIIRTAIEPILIEYSVDLVFSGHDHYYYNTKRNGIQYVVTAGAGAPLYTPNETQHAISGDQYFAKYHYCNVSVTDNKVTIEAHAYDDNLGYTTIEDTVTIYFEEQTPTKTTFALGFSLILIWIIPILRRKRK